MCGGWRQGRHAPWRDRDLAGFEHGSARRVAAARGPGITRLLGRGRRLLENLGDRPIALELVLTLEGVGVSHLKYRVRS